MSMTEKLFRIFSLVTLAVGFMVSVAGADSKDSREAALTVKTLIEDVKAAQEVNQINADVTPVAFPKIVSAPKIR